jgi:hypothetical protein
MFASLLAAGGGVCCRDYNIDGTSDKTFVTVDRPPISCYNARNSSPVVRALGIRVALNRGKTYLDAHLDG